MHNRHDHRRYYMGTMAGVNCKFAGRRGRQHRPLTDRYITDDGTGAQAFSQP